MPGPAYDDNGKPVIYGVSHRDGRTPVQIQFNPTTGGMKMDSITTIEFDPAIDVPNEYQGIYFARATSSDDDTTIRPWVVNEDTGAVLIDKT